VFIALLSVSVWPTLAHAECTYQPTATWGSAAGPGQLALPYGIAVDTDGNVVVVDTYDARVVIFDATGGFIDAFGTQGGADGQFAYPQGVAVDGSGNIFVADTANYRIQKFDITHQFVTSFSGPFLSYPGYVAVDSDGNVFVSDTGNRIWKFDNNGTLIKSWGASGSGPGDLDQPDGIAVLPGSGVFVVDTLNNRVQEFTGDGQLLAAWGSAGFLPGQFGYPYGIALDGQGDVFVTGIFGDDRVQEFTAAGAFITEWGSHGSALGQFSSPAALAVDAAGYVYVADTNNSRVEKFQCVTYICGDGKTDPGETCDDGNTASGDGCSSSCQVESGWSCDGTPSVCTLLCGDGLVDGDEDCDDAMENGTARSCCTTGCRFKSAGTACTGVNATCDGYDDICMQSTPCGVFPTTPYSGTKTCAASGGGWSVEAAIEDGGGLTVRNAILGSRYMAKEMSLPYYEVVLKTGRRAGQKVRGEFPLSHGGLNDATLVDMSCHDYPADADMELTATWLVPAIPGSNGSCLLFKQIYQFDPANPDDFCEPSGQVLCARFKPRVTYTFGAGPGDKLTQVRTVQRLVFDVDGRVMNGQQQADAVAVFRDVQPGAHCILHPTSCLSPVKALGNPMPHEVLGTFSGAGSVGPAIKLGGKKGKWDNFHETFNDAVQEPNLICTPGCPECVHMHWRWSNEANLVCHAGGGGSDFNGKPLIPDGSPQGVEWALTREEPGEEDPLDFRSLVDPPTSPASQFDGGELAVFWYSGVSTATTDEFFHHGAWFSPTPPPPPQ
jgi:cysteine-rich repeat protein